MGDFPLLRSSQFGSMAGLISTYMKPQFSSANGAFHISLLLENISELDWNALLAINRANTKT